MPMPNDPRPWWKKLGWLVLIWIASVTALAFFAWLLRLFMQAAGMRG